MITNYLTRVQNPLFHNRTKNWLKLISPVLMGFLFILMVIHIMNFGGPRESLVAKSDTEILRLALKSPPKISAKGRNDVVIFSVADSDLETVQNSSRNLLRDADIQEYAHVLEFVALKNPKWIVLSWLSNAQPLNQEHLRPITSVIDRLKLGDKVTIAVNFIGSHWLESEFRRRYNVVEARDCYHEVNIHCTVSKDWTWMPQQIVNRFFTSPQPWQISSNLPHHLPNIVLNLPPVSSLKKFRFLDARPPVLANIPENAIVFIGNNTTQDPSFRDNKEVLQRTYVAASYNQRSLQDDGIPWHEFWAAMTAMFLDSSIVSIAPSWLETLLCTLGTGFVLIYGLRKIDRMMIASFIGLLIALLSLNLITVPFISFYLPVTSIIITCITALTATVFIRLAVNNYRKQRLLAAENKAEELGDVKNNFLQMISHNLNTPIAQLRGLLEILESDSGDISALNRALLLSDYVRTTAKATLGASRLNEKVSNPQNQNLKDSICELLDDESGFLRRMGAELEVNWSSSVDDAHVLQLPLSIDPELLTNALLFCVVLILPVDRGSKVSLEIAVEKSNVQDKISVILDITATPLHEFLIHQEESLDFSRTTFQRYLDTATRIGVLDAKINKHHAQLVFNNII